MNVIRLITLVTIGMLGLSGPVLADNESDGGWDWKITPYLWATDITFDATISDMAIGGSVSFGDLLDKTDFAFMIHVDARRDRFGLFGDFLTTSLSDQTTVTIPPPIPPPLPGTVVIDTNSDTTIWELGGFYALMNDESSTLDWLFGVRALDVDADLTIVLPMPFSASLGDTYYDFLTGLRYNTRFSDKWSFGARGDFSFGDTEGTWNVLGAFGYHFGQKDQFAFQFGYRFLNIEIEGQQQTTNVKSELEMSGLIVGFDFNF